MDYGKELFCGGVAGTIGVFCGLPLDLVKVRMQHNPTKYRYTDATILPLASYALHHAAILSVFLTHLLTHYINHE